MTNQPNQPTPQFSFPTAYVGALPKNWEKAFGYQGQQRWLAAFWTPYGDEAYMYDGYMSGTANHSVYLDLERNRLPVAIKRAEAAMGLSAWALGSSDNEATHCLLCDLEKRLIFIAPLAAASRFMRQQYVSVNESQLSDAQLDRLWKIWEEEMKRQEQMAFIVCRHCINGYAATEQGYEPCVTCDNRGSWFVEVEKARTLKHDQIAIIWPAKEPLIG